MRFLRFAFLCLFAILRFSSGVWAVLPLLWELCACALLRVLRLLLFRRVLCSSSRPLAFLPLVSAIRVKSFPVF